MSRAEIAKGSPVVMKGGGMNTAPHAPDVDDVTEGATAPAPGTIRIEWSQLAQPYAHLRVRDVRAEGRLAATLAQQGQRSAALVVRVTEARYALIDGYRRARVLRAMGCDTIVVVALEVEQAEALAYCHRLETSRRRSALEDGWLVRELIDVHGRTASQAAEALGRSASWVSRRLGLVRALPASVEQAVRRGTLPPHAAMRSMLPLARANQSQCDALVHALGGERLTTRQAATLYEAWRSGDAEQRARIVQAPMLLLSAAASHKPDAGPKATRRNDEAGRLARDLSAAAALVWRAKSTLERALIVDRGVRRDHDVVGAYARVGKAYASLARRFDEHGAGDAGG